MKLKTILYYIGHPAIGYQLLRSRIDSRYGIKKLWRDKMSYPLDLVNPQGFNEKLNWLKLNDHNPQYTIMADKYLAKEWVAEKIGKEYITPTLAMYNSVDEIDINSLPKKFVLKCNHDSGSTIVCSDKAAFEFCEAKRKLEAWIKKNYYYSEFEWVYKNIKRCIIAEQYIDNENSSIVNDSLVTYKFMCFNGEPKIMYITVKNDDIWEDYFDMEYQPLNIKRKYRHSDSLLPKPQTWNEMRNIARKLSEGVPFLRVDLYEIGGKPRFSECTFYDWGGYCAFDNEWEKRLGDWLDLTKIKA